MQRIAASSAFSRGTESYPQSRPLLIGEKRVNPWILVSWIAAIFVMILIAGLTVIFVNAVIHAIANNRRKQLDQPKSTRIFSSRA